jgi:hypothetical protein
MPPKQAVSTNPTDSSTYPYILPLWNRDKIRLGKAEMGKLDPDAQPLFNIGQFDPCLPWFPRWNPLFALLRAPSSAPRRSS